MTRFPARDRIRAFYDRIGPRQDTQWWYEDPATAELAARADFEGARAVFELGCGTGRFAAEVLTCRLPATASWDAVDLSPVMVAEARRRLARFGSRVAVAQTDGEPPFPRSADAYDRFVANYVLDLMPPAAIDAVLAEAARLLEPGGRLCVAGLGHGRGPLSRVVASLWRAIHRVAPLVVGGCRPLDIGRRLDPASWRVRHHGTVVARGIPSEVLIAERR